MKTNEELLADNVKLREALKEAVYEINEWRDRDGDIQPSRHPLLSSTSDYEGKVVVDESLLEEIKGLFVEMYGKLLVSKDATDVLACLVNDNIARLDTIRDNK